MVRPVLIEVGVGIVAVGVLAYFLASAVIGALLVLGGVLVTGFGFRARRGDDD